MDSKRLLRRHTFTMSLALVLPCLVILMITSLANALDWPTWFDYVCYGSMIFYFPVMTIWMKRSTSAVMEGLPIRDSDAPFDPNTPSVSALELERFQRSSSLVYSRKGMVLASFPYAMIFVAIAGSTIRPSALSVLFVYFTFGLLLIYLERMFEVIRRRSDQTMREAGYRPRWWPIHMHMMRIIQWLCLAGFLVVVIYTATVTLWLCAAWIIAGLCGWFWARFAFGRYEREVFETGTVTG